MATSAELKKFAQIGRKILAVGRNYKDHALELGNPMPDKPLLFMKPTSSYVLEGNPIKFPKGCKELHHEVELGVVICKNGKEIPQEKAMEYVGGYVLALDMTARDLQEAAKKKGHPWTIAKGFDTSCPIGSFIPKELIKNPHGLNLWLKINEQLKQNGNTKDMHFTIPFLINYISNYFTLEPGDLILTGTPAGVGPVNSGDVIQAGIEGSEDVDFFGTPRMEQRVNTPSLVASSHRPDETPPRKEGLSTAAMILQIGHLTAYRVNMCVAEYK